MLRTALLGIATRDRDIPSPSESIWYVLLLWHEICGVGNSMKFVCLFEIHCYFWFCFVSVCLFLELLFWWQLSKPYHNFALYYCWWPRLFFSIVIWYYVFATFSIPDVLQQPMHGHDNRKTEAELFFGNFHPYHIQTLFQRPSPYISRDEPNQAQYF